MTIASEPLSGASQNLSSRLLVLGFGILAYVVFLGTFLYAIGFVGGVLVPKTIDSGSAETTLSAVVIDVLLLLVFAIQHSGMARRGFKRYLSRVVPAAVERSAYVLSASLALILVFAGWQPLPALVWNVAPEWAANTVRAISGLGWLIVLYSTFLISHFELFGLKQVVTNFLGRAASAMTFRTPGLYRVIRHPIYLGFIIAFWAEPAMTVGHLLFAAVTTGYIIFGIILEERDLVALFGDQYRAYRTRAAALLPGIF